MYKLEIWSSDNIVKLHWGTFDVDPLQTSMNITNGLSDTTEEVLRRANTQTVHSVHNVEGI